MMSILIPIGLPPIGGITHPIGGFTGVTMIHGIGIPGIMDITTATGIVRIMDGITMIPTGPTGTDITPIQIRKNNHLKDMRTSIG